MAKKKTIGEFLKEAKEMHPKLDFSLVDDYVNNTTNVKVICHEKDYCGNEHGVFEIKPLNLLSGKGCPKCNGKGFSSDERKKFCQKKYNDKYDYSKSDFTNVKEKTIVRCKEHGEFFIDYDHHFNNDVRCPLCSKNVINRETFINEATKTHNGFYSYEKSQYKNSHTKLIITCPIHGDFEQTPNAHLNGQGCPLCSNMVNVLEVMVKNVLEENNVGYIQNYRPTWLKTTPKGCLSLDFYIPQINLAIECQGKQHFGLGGWVKNYDFEKQFERDKLKNHLCSENNVQLIYFANKKEATNDYIGKIFTDLDELMDYTRYLLLK